MKAILSFVLISILFSSCYINHVNTMINEPAFEKKGQVSALGSAGLSHIQGQAAVSLTNHVGVLGGAYRGITGRRNISVYDYGLNLYSPISKNATNTLSLTLGGSFGKHKSRSGLPYIDGHIYTTTNSKYNSTYVQAAFIYNGHLSNVNIKTAFIAKVEQLNFSHYDVIFDYSRNKSGSEYRARQTDSKRNAMLFRPAISHTIKKDESIFFGQIQYGLNIVRGFNISETEKVEGYPYSGKDFSVFSHPQVIPFFFKIGFGVRF